MRALRAACLVIALTAVALAGCSGSSTSSSTAATGTSHPPTSSTGTGPGSTSTPPTTGPVPSGTDTPPAGNQSVQVHIQRLNANGAIPLTANMTVSATTNGQNVTSAQWAVHMTRTMDGNGTAVKSAATAGPKGSQLPTTLHLPFTQAGTYTVTVDVTVAGLPSTNASVIVVASTPAALPSIFFDGGETDTSQWTISSTTYVVTSNVVGGPDQTAPAPVPTGEKWVITDAEHKTAGHSWSSQYPDNYETKMDSVSIKLPAGKHSLSFALKGGVEQNGADGLHVLTGADASTLAEAKFIDESLSAWKTYTIAVSGSTLVIEFKFDADASCSDETSVPDNPVLSCGAGYDQGGYWIDDITVA